ncbi:MAG TPA: hypothetical protein VMT92_04075 [Steroidobacteraceae bacterium]|nr:hypothetical protein [Steroidobacteraceae bacterium]
MKHRQSLFALFTSAALAATLAATSAGAAGAPANAGGPCPKTGARVVITALGNVTLNGAPVVVDHLAEALNALKPRPSEVCYFREHPKGAPPAAVKIAVDAIISTKLAISFYSDATFTTRVGMPSH